VALQQLAVLRRCGAAMLRRCGIAATHSAVMLRRCGTATTRGAATLRHWGATTAATHVVATLQVATRVVAALRVAAVRRCEWRSYFFYKKMILGKFKSLQPLFLYVRERKK
jgi:hypothetical protein